MRDAYHEELDSIGDSLVEMARLVGSAIGRATTAILDSDLKLAESVIENDQRVDELQHDLEAKAIALKGDALRQNPNVVQMSAIEKWDGHLPTYNGGGALPFVNLQAHEASK